MKIRLALVAAALSASCAAVSFAQDATPVPAGDAKKGQALYRAVGCWECHGTQGQGGPLSGPKIGATLLPYDAFLQQLRTPQNQMPPYEPPILSDADAANIYVYVKSIPLPQAAKDIPVLNGLNLN
jgi:mono/diheme cytochrome c family protein